LDYYLFPNLKKHLKGRKCLSTDEVTLATLAANRWLVGWVKEVRTMKS
jgi:hypothetical protein